MALRVLLADESISIKKVIQLSLQDYGIEVKSVPVGIDVPEVARSFEPDIIFIDILLSKKSGYDVAKELKTQDSTKHIPIVLMWSGFMELDPKKAADAQADGQLEKPFDADQLRTLVKKLVPRLAGNTIANYIQFPQRPEFEEPAAPKPAAAAAVKPAATPKLAAVEESPVAREPDSFELQEEPAEEEAPAIIEMDAPEGLSFNSIPAAAPSSASAADLDIFRQPANSPSDDLPFLAEMDEPEDFQQVPLPRARGKQPLGEEGDESWMQSKLSDFRVEIPEDHESLSDPESDLTSTSIAVSGGETEVMLMDLDKELTGSGHTAIPVAPKAPPGRERPAEPRAPQAAASGLSVSRTMPVEKIEAIVREEIRAQTQQVLEEIAWKIIPEMAERIIREELAKLMKESEDLAP